MPDIEVRDYIVTVEVPFVVRVSAENPEQAVGIADDMWSDEDVARKIELGIDETSFYSGDPYEDWQAEEVPD